MHIVYVEGCGAHAVTHLRTVAPVKLRSSKGLVVENASAVRSSQTQQTARLAMSAGATASPANIMQH
jgi:hypothetical protein